MKDIIQKCLVKSDELKASVVAFPALGTGNLNYPINVAANIMINTIDDYFKANISTTNITTVKLVVYSKDHYQEFDKVLHANTRLLADKRKHDNAYSKPDIVSSLHSECLTLNTADLDSYKIGTVVVEFVPGDITDDDSNAIVNPTNEKMSLSSAGQVSNAILKKGGPEIQNSCNSKTSQGFCLKSGMVCPTDSSGSLRCKKVFHVNAQVDSLGEVVTACLQEAELNQLLSIAFPAIGTGALGYDIDIVAQLMCQPVIEFAHGLPKYVTRVRFVIFEQGMVFCFKQAFSALQAAKVSGNAQPSASDSSPSLFVQDSIAAKPKPALSLPCAHSVQRVPVITKTPVLLMKVFADDMQKVQHTERYLQDLIEKQLHVDEIKDDRDILKLPSELLSEIKQEADFKNVIYEITLKRQQPSVYLKGDRKEVEEIMNKIHSALKQIRDDEEEQQEFIATLAKIRWQWEKEPDVFEDYEDAVSYEVERAYRLDPKQFFVYHHKNGTTERFCFSQMIAEHKSESDSNCFVIQRKEKAPVLSKFC